MGLVSINKLVASIVILIGLIAFVVIGFGGYRYANKLIEKSDVQENVVDDSATTELVVDSGGLEFTDDYDIYVDNTYEISFHDLNEAKEYAEYYDNAYITTVDNNGVDTVVWRSNAEYTTYVDNVPYEFDSYAEAVYFAKRFEKADVQHKGDYALVWSTTDVIKSDYMIQNVPLYSQLPELPRGCEVTSLSMLLASKNIEVSKMELAENVKKDNTPYRVDGGKIYYGNPHDGFVGDMYNLNNNGLGVYNEPLFALMESYLPYKSLNITGCDFEEVLRFVNYDSPVLVITNVNYNVLPMSDFVTWNTPSGAIDVTYKEHAVVVVGYDSQYIYINDPLNKTRVVDVNQFRLAWEQMGRQALTYSH